MAEILLLEWHCTSCALSFTLRNQPTGLTASDVDTCPACGESGELEEVSYID